MLMGIEGGKGVDAKQRRTKQGRERPQAGLLSVMQQRKIVVGMCAFMGLYRWVSWPPPGQRSLVRESGCDRPSVSSGAALVQFTPRLSVVGVPFYALARPTGDLWPVVAQLTQAIEAHKRAHPDDDFPRCITESRPCCAASRPCFCAPLFGIDTLPPSIPMSIRSRHSLAGGITAPR